MMMVPEHAEFFLIFFESSSYSTIFISKFLTSITSRNCDHRDSGRDASAGVEQRPREGMHDFMHQ